MSNREYKSPLGGWGVLARSVSDVSRCPHILKSFQEMVKKIWEILRFLKTVGTMDTLDIKTKKTLF